MLLCHTARTIEFDALLLRQSAFLKAFCKHTYTHQISRQTHCPCLLHKLGAWPSIHTLFFLPPPPLPLPGRPVDGRGAGVRPLLLPARGRDVPALLGAAGYIRPGGRVPAHGRRQAPEVGALLGRLLLHAGIQHQGILHGRHAGRLQGKLVKIVALPVIVCDGQFVRPEIGRFRISWAIGGLLCLTASSVTLKG